MNTDINDILFLVEQLNDNKITGVNIYKEIISFLNTKSGTIYIWL